MPDLAPHYRIIKRLLLTEKGTYQQEHSNTFAFEVDAKSNKIQIRQAIEQIFGVRVLQVRTMMMPGKIRKFGWSYGHTPAWKKALVTLREGETIHQV